MAYISAVQSPGFHLHAAPGKKLRLRQEISSSGKFVKIRNLMEISHSKVEALSLFFILFFILFQTLFHEGKHLTVSVNY